MAELRFNTLRVSAILDIQCICLRFNDSTNTNVAFCGIALSPNIVQRQPEFIQCARYFVNFIFACIHLNRSN